MPKPIKILHVIQKMHSGGVEQRKLLLAQHLPKDTFEQKIICSEADSALRQKFEAANCEVIEIGQLRHPLHWIIHQRAIKIIRRFKPDIIHGSVFEGNTISVISGLICHVPIKIIEETSYPVDRTWRANLLLRLLAAISSQVIAISPAVKEYLTNHTGMPNGKVKIIPNGVRNPTIITLQEKLDLRKAHNIDPTDFVIGSIGRMENNIKGFDHLINSFPSIKKVIPNAKLLIIGNGPLLESYKGLTTQLGIQRDVIFTGYQSEVNDYYEIMDFYITLPRSEGFGLTIVEAMSHKLPVIATNVGGIRNIIHHDKNGYMLTNKTNLIELIEKLSSDQNKRYEIGQEAYLTYLNNFSTFLYTQMVKDTYISLIKR